MSVFRLEAARMRIIPSKRVVEEFLLTYELKGCQKAVNVLTRYYGIRRMKIVVNGRRVGNGDEGDSEFGSRRVH